MSLNADDLEKLRGVDPNLYKALARKLSEGRPVEDPSYVKAMFPAQHRFYASRAKRKAALCSRRAGKTYALACWLLEGASELPNGLSVYIALSRASARLILWATMEEIAREHGVVLQFTERDGQLTIICENGHRIWLSGCPDKPSIEKYRGLKIKRACIDEAASFPEYIRPLVFDVLEPALLDYSGEIALISTPAVLNAGLFFEITTGQGVGDDAAAQWETHHWTLLDNPYLPHAAEWLERKRRENRWAEDHPRYVREYKGQWVLDAGELCYPISPKLNHYYTLPESGDWRHVIGVDVGYEDSTAFVVAAFRRGHPEIYIVFVEKREHLIPSVVAARIQKLKATYKASRVIMDVGGLGKGYAEEAAQRYGVMVEPAGKQHKRGYMEIVRGELLSGTIKVCPRTCAPLILECNKLVWNEKGDAPDDSCVDHAADAFLYLCRGILSRRKYVEIPDKETEAMKAQRINDEHRERTLAKIKNKVRDKLTTARALRDIAKPKRFDF